MINNFKFDTTEYILYLLQKIEPSQSTKLKLNKIAFFVEFGYLHKIGRELSKSNYAGIVYGPVINNYKLLLSQMQRKKMIIIDGNYVRPLKGLETKIPDNISSIIDPLIEKYSKLTSTELVKLSHLTDSYQITTNGEKEMGKIIDKDLAALESFYDDENCDEKIDETKLPRFNPDDLIPYAIR